MGEKLRAGDRKVLRRVQETKKAGDKVHIIATGNQAPYGIGETIAIIPAGHRRKIAEALDQWYNRPDVELHRRMILGGEVVSYIVISLITRGGSYDDIMNV